MGKLFFIRHGQASVFADNYDQLSDLGYRQSQAVGDFLQKENIPIHKIFVGPLTRHRQTLDSIIKKANYLEDAECLELEGLREHQGFRILKTILPHLIDIDPKIKELVNLPFSSREEQIQHHIRIYDHFVVQWSQELYKDLIPEGYQNWQAFHSLTAQSYQEIITEVRGGDNVLVITSGGPISVACGEVLDLSIEKILSLSTMIYNASITSFVLKENTINLSFFNHISHLKNPVNRTLV